MICLLTVGLVVACSVERSPLGARSGGFGGTAGIAGFGGTSGTAATGGVGAVGGSGAVGGTGGTGGTGGISGTGGAAGIAGTGGTGGISGTGGIGGTGGVPACQTNDDLKTGSLCADAAQGWFAIKNDLDVWWQGIPTRDPGRGNILIYLLAKMENVCSDGSAAEITIKACGTRLPPFTSDVACDAFQIQFPDSIWDSPTMPRFHTYGSTTGFNPGDILQVSRTTGLVGIDLMNGTEDGAWPTSMMTGSFRCENGTGERCFPDHDNDGKPGISIVIRSDEAIYTSDLDSGTCSTGTPYRYRGAPTGAFIDAGGGGGGGIRAARVQIGIRTRISGQGTIGNDCASGNGPAMADFLDSRAYSCEVTPSSLPTGPTQGTPFMTADPRIATMNYACTGAEAQFVDDNVPIYIVLQQGQVPGDSKRPNGWSPNPFNNFLDRDIKRHRSMGPRSAIVRLGDLAGPEPSCATVRDVSYPGL